VAEAGSAKASTTVSCSFGFAAAPLNSATTSALRSSEADCYSVGSTGKKAPTVAVGFDLSAIKLAVMKTIHSLQTPDSKVDPNEHSSSATLMCRP
jgi:hypothetical protein